MKVFSVLFMFLIGTTWSQELTNSKKLRFCPEDINTNWHKCWGTAILENGDTVTGEFKNDDVNGLGTYTYADGDKYVGEFKNGNFYGKGTYTFANGNKYVGEFKDNKKHGQGTFTFANGSQYIGKFKDNNPVDTKKWEDANPVKPKKYSTALELRCGDNVNCNNHIEVVNKMRSAFSMLYSTTNQQAKVYKDICFDAFKRVESFPQHLQGKPEVIQPQLGACNMGLKYLKQ